LKTRRSIANGNRIHGDITDPAELAITTIALVRKQAPETRLLPIAAWPVAEHPEYQRSTGSGVTASR
jgi:hypothetical protein